MKSVAAHGAPGVQRSQYTPKRCAHTILLHCHAHTHARTHARTHEWMDARVDGWAGGRRGGGSVGSEHSERACRYATGPACVSVAPASAALPHGAWTHRHLPHTLVSATRQVAHELDDGRLEKALRMGTHTHTRSRARTHTHAGGQAPVSTCIARGEHRRVHVADTRCGQADPRLLSITDTSKTQRMYTYTCSGADLG